MKLTAWAVVGLSIVGLSVSLGQVPGLPTAPSAPAPQAPAGPRTITLGSVKDVMPARTREHKLDMEYKPEERKSIAHVELIVSADQGQTWTVTDKITPDKDHLNFFAKEDGLYYLNMVIVFRNGARDPRDPSQSPPALKMLIDTVPPVVKIVNLQRQGEETMFDWTIDDKYANDSATQVMYKAASNPLNEWTSVPAGAVNRRSARFRSGVTGPLLVRVIAADFAGNTADVAKELPVAITASYTPPVPAEPPVPILPVSPAVAPPAVGAGAGGVTMPVGLIPAAVPNLAPVPTNPASVPTGVAPGWNSAANGTPGATANATAVTPMNALPLVAPAAPQTVEGGPQAIGSSVTPFTTAGGTSPAPLPASAPAIQGTFLRTPDFELRYQLENNGPSGISRVDLYVTRDEGRSWAKWSSHDGKEMPLRVRLARGYDSQRDGEYGLKLVPVSGVGLADDVPTAGTPPELRVTLDTTPPVVEIYPHAVAPSQPNAVVLNWSAKDANFGANPITVEWSESPGGPWKSVAPPDGASASFGLASASTSAPCAGLTRLPNTGQYTWTLPATMPTHRVYLRVTAIDAASNRGVAVTREPITVDLLRPKARIMTVSASEISPRP